MLEEWRSTESDIVDGHVHMRSFKDELNLIEITKSARTDQTVLVSIQNPAGGSGLPQSFHMKAKYPKQFFLASRYCLQQLCRIAAPGRKIGLPGSL